MAIASKGENSPGRFSVEEEVGANFGNVCRRAFGVFRLVFEEGSAALVQIARMTRRHDVMNFVAAFSADRNSMVALPDKFPACVDEQDAAVGAA